MEEMSSTDSSNGDEVEVEEKRGCEPNECAICNEDSPNGTIICNSCSKNFGNVKTVITCLKTLRRCSVKEYGCKEIVHSGQLSEHEGTCQFKPINCFIPDSLCTWKGQQKDVMTHVSQNHPHHIIKDGKLSLCLKSKVEETVVVFEKNDVVTALFYNYNDQTKEFGYCIRYFFNSGVDKVHTITISNTNNTIYLKNKMHKPYEEETSFKSEIILNLNYILSYLGNNSDSVLISAEIKTASEYKKLKCFFCHVYVTFPAYELLDALVCSDCEAKDSSDLELVEDQNLKKIASELTYPCRWKYCTHVDTHDKIRGHEKECTYREIICPVQNCYEIFEMSYVDTHFQTTHENITRNVPVTLHLKTFKPGECESSQIYVVSQRKSEVFLVTYTFSDKGMSCTKFPESVTSKVFGIIESECCKDVAIKYSSKVRFNDFGVYCCHNKPLRYLRFAIEE